MHMQTKRQNVLRELNTLRKQLEPFQKFNTLYHKHKKALQPEDQSILDVYYVETKLQENKTKEALEWALSDFKVLEYNQDLKCLLGQIYYEQKMYPQALQYFNKLDHQSNKQQFLPEWYKDGTLQTCQSVSVELLINALFRRGWLEAHHNNDPQRAVKSYEECFNLISSNVQAIAYQYHSGDKDGSTAATQSLSASSNASVHDGPDKLINLELYSYRAYQCIVQISRIMLQTGQLSPCLTNVRASLQLSSHLEDFFHRKMLFKLGLLTFHYLSPVDWHTINPKLFAASTLYAHANKNNDCYIPRSIDEEAILALMVHQRLCQLTLQRSIKHKHRRRAQELRLQKQKALTHQQTLQKLQLQQQQQQQQHSAAQHTVVIREDLKEDQQSDDEGDIEESKTDALLSEDVSSLPSTSVTSAVSSFQPQVVNVKYILKDEEMEKIENENLLSLLFLTILLSVKREFYGLSRCILRSLNERQMDCRRWYKYALSLYGNNQLNECIRACHHSLQHDTTINTVSYRGGDTKVLRHYFILSSCLLAARSALLLHDDKSALSYGRAAVRLSLDKHYLNAVQQQYTQNNVELIHYILVDQRCLAYLLFSIACSQSAYSDTLCSFEDRKSLHKLAMKSVIRACILSPRNQTIVFNLALCRADLGDVDGALIDVRSLLQNLHPYHAESWHLLSLLLSSKRKWMESYRAIDQALRYCTFISSSSLNKFNCGNYHSLRVFYRYKLKLTKLKILMKQNRISSPLQIFNELSKMLDFNERFYKMAKLPNSHKLCPLFQPLSSKSNEEVLEILQEDSSNSAQFKRVGHNEHIMFSLLLLRLEYILTLTSFYLQESVAAHKYAFHCMEFALQFFGASIKNDYFQRYDFNRAIQAKILSDIYCKMGECCEVLQHSSLALSHYKTAITYNASHYKALIGQSRIYLLNNDLLQSKSFIDTALKINAYSHQAWSVLAQIQQQQKLHEQASNSYLTSLELERDQPIECYSLVPRWLPS